MLTSSTNKKQSFTLLARNFTADSPGQVNEDKIDIDPKSVPTPWLDYFIETPEGKSWMKTGKAVLGPIFNAYGSLVNALTRGPKDLHDIIKQVEDTGKKVCVVGCGISGVQAIKACLAEGMHPTCFESDEDLGGFWRYKEDTKHPSVYRSTHIDTDRDINSFGDRPYTPDKPLLITNKELTQYLRDNVAEFKLDQYIRYNTECKFITPLGEAPNNRWKVTSATTDLKTNEVRLVTEEYDFVLVASGRHGGGAYIPFFPGLTDGTFQGQWFHSSQYKYPEKHDFDIGKKNVVVVGIGNSGADIITELGEALNSGKSDEEKNPVLLVARSGGWVTASSHGEVGWSSQTGDRTYMNLVNSLPWWYRNDQTQRLIEKQQATLNKYGMTPKHKFAQQHGIVSGLAGQIPLHSQLTRGWVHVKRSGIERFTKDSIIFQDGTEHKCDAVVFATGYRQQVPFVDPKVVDMRYERQGNDVPLYKGCLPISEYKGLGFVNFIQTATFMAAELQSRYMTRVFKGLIAVPSLEEQDEEMRAVRNALAAQYIDKQQLKVQHGVSAMYYRDLAEIIGCEPTWWKILTQRPTAVWHAMFTVWQGLQYRLVGPGRIESAEKWIEDLYDSRVHGKFSDKKNKLYGKDKPVLSREKKGEFWWLHNIRNWYRIGGVIDGYKKAGWTVDWRMEKHLENNLKYAETDGLYHSLEVGDEIQDGHYDGVIDSQQKRIMVFENRQAMSEAAVMAINVSQTAGREEGSKSKL